MFFAGKNWRFPKMDERAHALGGVRVDLPDGSSLIASYSKLRPSEEYRRIVDDLKGEGWELVTSIVFRQNRDHELSIFWKRGAGTTNS